MLPARRVVPLGSCVPESRAGDGDPVLSPVAPLCGVGWDPVASRLRAAVCLVPPWEASPDPDRRSALACRAHRGGLRRASRCSWEGIDR